MFRHESNLHMSESVSHTLVAKLTVISGAFCARYMLLAKNEQTQSVDCEVRSDSKGVLDHPAYDGI